MAKHGAKKNIFSYSKTTGDLILTPPVMYSDAVYDEDERQRTRDVSIMMIGGIALAALAAYGLSKLG